MTWLSSRVFLPAVALFSCFIQPGCSRVAKRTEVHGMVTVKGQAPNIPGLRISFIGSDNQSVTATVGLNGEYNANVLSGDNLVVVSWQPPDDQNPFRAGKPKYVEGAPPSERAPKQDPNELLNSPIPLRYASPATSGLNCIIEADKANTFNVDLVD